MSEQIRFFSLCTGRWAGYQSCSQWGDTASKVLLVDKMRELLPPQTNARGIIQDSEKHLNESGHPTSARQKWDKSYRLLLWSKTRGSDDKCMKSVICFKNIYLSNLLQVQPIEI